MTLCRWLRWKAWYQHETFTEAELSEHFARNEVPYSCLKTFDAGGPDGDLAAPECCGPGRGCYEKSPKLRGTVA